VPAYGADTWANDRFKSRHDNPSLPWIATGVLLVLVIALLATYVLRPGRSPADDAQTAEAVRKMDQSQSQADTRRDEKRNATSLL
jgi:hypothetical protein